MESELEAIIRANPAKLQETDVKVISYILKKSLDNRDLRCTSVSSPELQKFLQQQGYSEEDARREALFSLERLEIHLPSQWEIEEVEGKKYNLRKFYPGLYIRLLGGQYLKKHPEIKDVKE